MTTIKHSFSRTADADFYATLKSRVNNYFQENKISRFGNKAMIFKTIFVFALFFVPYGFIVSGLVTGIISNLILWILMGAGIACIGLCVMHDANHGALSSNKNVNKILSYSLNIIGGDSEIWRCQHNVLHHTYTNITGADEDINPPPILRFSPHEKKSWFHKFQHIYAWFFYGLLTLSWIVIKDFKLAVKYKKMGVLGDHVTLTRKLITIVLWKMFYIGYVLIIPLYVSPAPTWVVVTGFFLMNIVASVWLSLIFQAAHVMPTSEYPLPDSEGKLDTNWAVHQLTTTANFAPKSNFLFWIIGGLNYQVEHHLFSHISHIHYRELAKIVESTAKEYGIPYFSQPTFRDAIVEHVKMLKTLGTFVPETNTQALPA
jgi:linoleoyl-CoA desaturase